MKKNRGQVKDKIKLEEGNCKIKAKNEGRITIVSGIAEALRLLRADNGLF